MALKHHLSERQNRHGATLVITVDCGITSVETATLCRKEGIDLIITDHHEPIISQQSSDVACQTDNEQPTTNSYTLPDAVAVINPKLSGRRTPVSHLSGAGVALKLVHALSLSYPGQFSADEFLDLAALAVRVTALRHLAGRQGTRLRRRLESGRQHLQPRLYTVPVGGKPAVNRTAANEAADTVPLYSPDGRWLAWGQQRTKGFYGDIRRLMLLDRRGGAVREVLGDAWDRSAEGLAWAPDSKRLYGAIDDAGSVRMYEITLDGKTHAVTGEESFGSLAASATATGSWTASARPSSSRRRWWMRCGKK